MKPSAALAAGLWIGAAAGLLIGAVYFRSVLNRGSESAQSDADLNTQAAKIKALQSERARLDAEMKRLRQTVAEMHRINPSTPSSLATERGSRFNPPTSPATTEPTPPVGPPGEPPSTIRPVDLPPVPEGSDDPSTNTAPKHAIGAARIVGKVLFVGQAPTPKKINVSADPKCAELHATEPLYAEDVVVNENGTLRNVFVYVASGLENLKFDTPTESVLLDQVGCRYEPHVFGMMTGQKLVIRNSDPTLHNIHGLPLKNPEFNIGQPNQGKETTKLFTQPELKVRIKCDVHPWMSAYVYVLAHPFFAVTGQNGTFALQGLPAGAYTVGAWHEKYAPQLRQVVVTADEMQEITFSFPATP